MLGVGVGVAVAHPITEGVAIPVGIAQVGGHLLALGLPHGFHRIEEAQAAVALLGAGQVKGGVGEGVEALRQPDPVEGGGAGLHHHHGLGVGQAHVLAGGDQHAAEDEAGVFAGFHHPRQPEEGGIGIGAPQRFDEGADRVEVGIPLFVVEHGSLLDRFLGDRQVDLDHPAAVGRACFHCQLQGIEQAAGIAAGHIEQVVGRIGTDRHLPLAVAVLRVGQGPLQQAAQILRFEGLEPEQPRAAHQGLIHLKEGVFGGGTDQAHGAVLHPGQ